jgi:hypothetical protein
MRWSLLRVSLIVALSLCPALAFAQVEGSPEVQPDATTKASIVSQVLEAGEHPLVGEPLKLRLEIRHPRDTRVILPDGIDSTRWELISRHQFDQPGEQGQKTVAELTFAVYRPGPSTLPSFPLSILGYSDEPIVVHTEPVTVTIRSVLQGVDESSFHTARPSQSILVNDYRPAWYAGVALTLLLAGLLALVLRRRQRYGEDLVPERPAHEVALEKLEALARGTLLDQGETMIFYVRMSEAVREYLGRRYDFPGLELTTTEIIAELDRSLWPPLAIREGLTRKDAAKWLEHCDFVKFSGYLPPRERAEASLKQAFAIVRLTTVVEATPDTEPDAREAS